MSQFQIKRFSGTDNVSDRSKLQIRRDGSLYFHELINVDIDDEGMPHRRKGFLSDALVTGARIGSAWSNGEVLLYLDGTTLKLIDREGVGVSLITNIDPDDRMAYIDVADVIYFSNNSIIGYIYKKRSYPFPNPDQTFKIRMVGGHILEYFNSRLYAANDRNLFYSDATVLTRMDKRKNAIAFPDRITMVKAVQDGIYVSADNKTYFMGGLDPSEFVLKQVLDEAAIEGSAITVDGDDLWNGMTGRAIYFLTASSLYKGYPGGIVIERQGGRFAPGDDIEYATAILKEDLGYRQYVALCQLKAGVGRASISMRLPTPLISNV